MSLINQIITSPASVQILVIFLMILLGYVVRKKNVVTQAFNKELSSFVMNVALPAFILKSMAFDFSFEILKKSTWLVVISFCVYGFSIVLSKFYSKIMGNEGASKAVLEYVIIFSNTGYMGYPVVAQIFGDIGVFYAAIYNLSFNILVWSYGVDLLRSKDEEVLTLKMRLKHLVNPGLIALAVGYFMFLTGLKFPAPIKVLLDAVGNTTTPLSMMFIGFILTEINIKSSFKNPQLWYVGIIRLIIIPAVTFLGLTMFGFTGLTLYIPVVISAMPAAVNTAVFSAKYDSDYQLASLLIFSSTFFSAITIPLLLLIIK